MFQTTQPLYFPIASHTKSTMGEKIIQTFYGKILRRSLSWKGISNFLTQFQNRRFFNLFLPWSWVGYYSKNTESNFNLTSNFNLSSQLASLRILLVVVKMGTGVGGLDYLVKRTSWKYEKTHISWILIEGEKTNLCIFKNIICILPIQTRANN